MGAMRGVKYIPNDENVNGITCSDPPNSGNNMYTSTLTWTFVHNEELIDFIDYLKHLTH